MDAIIRQKFKDKYATNPTICLHAPARINLIGEHTDYNGGWVLPASIAYHISFAASKVNANAISIYNENVLEDFHFDLQMNIDINTLSNWQKFYYGAVHLLSRKFTLGGFQVLKLGSVPLGAGLSSSAALACGFIACISKLFTFNLEPLEIAQLAQQIEHEYLGVQCGIMDQFAVVFGEKNHLLFLNCSDLSYKALPFSLGEYEFILMNSKVKHSLVDSAYNERVQEIQTVLSLMKEQNFDYENASQIKELNLQLIADNTLKNRALHVLSENQRVLDFIQAMSVNDWQTCGDLLTKSHNSLKNLYEVSCDESDFLVDTAITLGALGARQMGGGFGGIILMLLPKSTKESFQEKIWQLYNHKFNLQAAFYPVEIVDGLAKSL